MKLEIVNLEKEDGAYRIRFLYEEELFGCKSWIQYEFAVLEESDPSWLAKTLIMHLKTFNLIDIETVHRLFGYEAPQDQDT